MRNLPPSYKDPAALGSVSRAGSSASTASTTFTVRLDPDMLPALEDQAHAQGLPFDQWLQGAVNEALRSYLGI